VEIVDIAREAGVRTKLAVRSTQEGVDPVGSCVGQRGVRVQEVIRELNNEKIDITPHSDDLKVYVQGALAPAENLEVEINEKQKKLVVTVPEDQLSLAIGRGGQNVRLAAKLLGYSITIQSGGKVQSTATGQEEYEIDNLKNLSEEARDYLIQNKLTTSSDLMRFKNKWETAEELDESQIKLIAQYISQVEAEIEKKDKEREAQAAGKVDVSTKLSPALDGRDDKGEENK
jgi:transcription antitermination factor NusA-like protein